MEKLINLTLSEIVLQDHRAAPVLEKYNLDFCCKGKRTLEQACADKQIPVSQILSELQNVEPGSCSVGYPFHKLPLGILIDHVEKNHHAYTREVMPQIVHYLQKITTKHGDTYPYMHKVLAAFLALKEEMELHMDKEEKVLFPRIRQAEQAQANAKENKLNPAYLQSPIQIMEQEHAHAGSVLEEIRSLCRDYVHPATACTTHRICLDTLKAFEADLHLHVHLENNILFPRALEVFKSITPA